MNSVNAIVFDDVEILFHTILPLMNYYSSLDDFTSEVQRIPIRFEAVSCLVRCRATVQASGCLVFSFDLTKSATCEYADAYSEHSKHNTCLSRY
jgi:hypothetical protein